MEVPAVAFLILASAFLEASGSPKPRSEIESSSDLCELTYSCDMNVAKVCRPGGSVSVACTGGRQCDPASGSCVLGPLLGLSQGSECDSVYSCSDCHSVRVCRPMEDGSLEVLSVLPCPGDSPYCDTRSGSCVAQEPADCGSNTAFFCVRDGQFPNADCGSYTVCEELEARTVSCAGFAHYDPTFAACDTSTSCASFSCAGSEGMKVPHPLDPHFFAFCGSSGPLTVDSCPGAYELNVTSQVCEPACHSNGLIQDIQDCHFYYKCSEIFVNSTMKYFEKERKRCPYDEAFDPSEYLCVSDVSHISGCLV